MTQMMLANLPLFSNVVITDGQWHEVGFEWDGQYRHLFVDGERAASDNLQIPNLKASGWLNIGTDSEDETGNYWSGLVDEVKVYTQGPHR